MVFMPHWPQIMGSKPIDLGLDRVLQALNKLGNPQQKLPPVVHFAGTNGKGSTIAFLRSFLECAGYKAHIYTSPHLLNFNERIRIAGHNISDQDLYQVMEECRIATKDIPLTFFEGTTAGAFLAFSKNDADIVLLETGLGGRLDATNVVENPLLTVLTPISIDHTEYLGPTIPLIAQEKTGILKKNSPCISSLQSEEADKVIQKRAEELDIPLFAFEYDWIVEKTESGMRYKSKQFEVDLPTPNLLGDHQILNAGTAIAASQHLKGFNITKDHIIEGITKAKWPARLQKIDQGPLAKTLPEDWELWIDGAHNEAAAYTLANMLSDCNDKPLYIICGMTKGRDPETFLHYFKDKAEFVCGVLVETEPSALSGETIANAAKNLGIESKAFSSAHDAIEFLTGKQSEPTRILCCGSLYLASDILKANNNSI